MKSLNCCIVCYKSVHSFPSVTPIITGECVTARFVRLFQRHVNDFSLESTQIKIRNSTLTFLSRNGTKNERRLQACATCREMLSSFNTLYDELKCAEMKVNWGLQQLTNVIRLADSTPARPTKFRKSVGDLEADNLLVDDMIENISSFRKLLQNRCHSRYQNQFPRVVLTKPSPICSDNDDDADDEWNLGDEDDYGDGGNDMEKEKHDSVDSAPIGSDDESTNTYTKYKMQIVKNVTSQSCSSCQLDFASEKEFQQHLITCSKVGHDPDAVNASTSSDVEIKQEPMEIPPNQKNKRKGMRRYQCNQCGLRCRYPSELRQHVLVHLGPDNWRLSCSICGKKFIKKVSLKVHLKTHSATFKCSVDNCEMAFSSQHILHRHELTHLGPKSSKHICSYCGKNFTTKKSMHRHMRIHTGEKPFKCPEEDCELSFTDKTNLLYHVQKYHGSEARKHFCSYCGKNFIYKNDMERHESIHTGERPFKCQVDGCDKGYSRRDYLEKHLKVSHDISCTTVTTEVNMETQT